MVNLENHSTSLNELFAIHKYIKKRLITLAIISAIISVISIIGLIIFTKDDQITNPLGYVAIVLLCLNWLLLIPIVKYINAFIYGNYPSTLLNIIEKETEYSFKEVLDKKEKREMFLENTNLFDKYSSFQATFLIEVYDKEDFINKKFTYSQISITYSKSSSFLGYAVTFPFDKIDADCKLLPIMLYPVIYGYKQDKDITSNEGIFYYYNKKNITLYNPLMEKIFASVKKAFDEVYGEDEVVFGLAFYNKMLTIIINHDKKYHPLISFSLKLKNEKIKKNLEAIIKDIELIDKKIQPVLESME